MAGQQGPKARRATRPSDRIAHLKLNRVSREKPKVQWTFGPGERRSGPSEARTARPGRRSKKRARPSPRPLLRLT